VDPLLDSRMTSGERRAATKPAQSKISLSQLSFFFLRYGC
jgi:hypothetical protein